MFFRCAPPSLCGFGLGGVSSIRLSVSLNLSLSALLSVGMPASQALSFVEEIDIFDILHANAVQQWSLVEASLFGVVSACLVYTPGFEDAFHSIENFRSKLAFADKIVKGSPAPQSISEQWIEISATIQRLSKKRNLLAHGRYIKFNAKNREGRRAAIFPTSVRPSGDQPPPGSICLRDLDLINQEFKYGNWLLITLSSQIAALRARKPVPHAELAPIKPQSRSLSEIKHQIRVGTGLRPRSSRA